MATRLYPAIKCPGVFVEQSPRGNWGAVGGAHNPPWARNTFAWELSTSKADCGTRTMFDGSTAFVCNHLHDATTGTFLFNWFTPPLNGSGTISSTLQLCFLVMTRWVTASTITTDAHLRYMVTVSLADANGLHKAYLAQDIIDSVDLQRNPAQSFIWQSLASAISLASVAYADGDRIRIEIGYHIQSAPAAALAYPPAEATKFSFGYTGANSGDADAVAGTQPGNQTAWFEFSQNFTFKTSAAPPNATCGTAQVLGPSLPAVSTVVDTTQAPGTEREAWFTWTAPAVLDGAQVIAAAHGSNYQLTFDVFKNGCGVLTPVSITKSNGMAPGRSQGAALWSPVANTQYHIRVRNVSSFVNASNSGGSLLVRLAWLKLPQEGDVWVGAGSLVSYRDGVMNNLYPGFGIITGMAFDLSKRTMDNIHGGTNSNERLLVALHDGFIEILDLENILSEVDFIDSTSLGQPPLERIHPASIIVGNSGKLYVGCFGNGYLFVEGMGISPNPSAYFNAVSNSATLSNMRRMNATDGQGQAGAPFTAEQFTLPLQKFSAWAIAIDDAAGIVYYTTGSIYSWMDWSTTPNAAGSAFAASQIQRYNFKTLTALTPITVQGFDPWAGVRGLYLMSLGRILVANGNDVLLISLSTGQVLRQYNTDDPLDGWDLVAVAASPDEQFIYAIDETSAKLFKWSYETGALLQTIDTKLFIDGTTQLLVYSHQCECCVATQIQIMNDALFAIGVSKTITALGEATREAVTCENFYSKAIEETLRRHPWAFATKYARSTDNLTGYMNLIDGSVDDPINRDWTFGYQYPIDCITARRVVPVGEGRKYNRNPIPFRVGRQWVDVDGVTPLASDDDRRLIFTDEPDAELEYTALVTCAENFSDPLFKSAVVWLLASKIAPSLSRVAKMAALCEDMFKRTIKSGETVDMQEQQQEKTGDADWISDRD